jgi:hypothetical protein
MQDPKMDVKDPEPVLDEASRKSPGSGSDEEITRKMEELGYLDCGLDI